MKKSYIAIALLTLTLCACKGRTASVPVSDGDTVEVVINADDPSATVDAASDSAFSVSTAEESIPGESADPSSKSDPTGHTKMLPPDSDISF